MKNNSVLFTGTFDPITKGHMHVIKIALSVFDYLYINIGSNFNKKNHAFDIAKRIEMICKSMSVHNIEQDMYEIHAMESMTYKIAADFNIKHVIRGIRDSSEFNREMNLSRFLHKHDINTLLVPGIAPEISSSTAKEIAYSACSIDELSDITDYHVAEALFYTIRNQDA